jgi:hypothetical protein
MGCRWVFLNRKRCLAIINTPWREVRDKIPELAVIGYNAIYLPPPFKAGGGTFSYGFDTFDRFDLGKRIKWGRCGLSLEQLESSKP